MPPCKDIRFLLLPVAALEASTREINKSHSNFTFAGRGPPPFREGRGRGDYGRGADFGRGRPDMGRGGDFLSRGRGEFRGRGRGWAEDGGGYPGRGRGFPESMVSLRCQAKAQNAVSFPMHPKKLKCPLTPLTRFLFLLMAHACRAEAMVSQEGEGFGAGVILAVAGVILVVLVAGRVGRAGVGGEATRKGPLNLILILPCLSDGEPAMQPY